MNDTGKPASRTLFCGCVVTSYPAEPLYDWPAGSVRRWCAECVRDGMRGGGDHTRDHDMRHVKLGLL